MNSKKQITTFFLLFTLRIVSQNFNGSYSSMQTSFFDSKNSKNNFKENTLFNITVVYDTAKIANSYILIQDPRIPKKVLTYKIKKQFVKMPSDEYTISSYIFNLGRQPLFGYVPRCSM